MFKDRFIVYLLLGFFVANAVCLPIHINYPHVPLDFYAYLGGAELLLSGGQVYNHTIGEIRADGSIIYDPGDNAAHIYPYGPMTALTYGAWIIVFGNSFLSLKILSLVFSCVVLVAVYMLAERFCKDRELARYVVFFFACSYVVFTGVAHNGEDDFTFLSVMLVALYLIVSGRILWGSAAYAVAMGYKIVPLALVPFIAYYVFRKAGLRTAAVSLAIMVVGWAAILFPFYLNSGIGVLYPYFGINAMPFSGDYIGLLSPLHLAKLLVEVAANVAYLAKTGQVIPYESNPLHVRVGDPIDDVFSMLATPFTAVCVFSALAYMALKRISDPEVELARNSFLMIFSVLVTSRYLVPIYFSWTLPYLFSLMVLAERERFKKFAVGGDMRVGIGLMFVAVLVMSFIRRDQSNITQSARVVLAVTPLLVCAATYLIMRGSGIARVWSLIMFSCALFDINPGNPLLLFSPLLSGFVSSAKVGFRTYLEYFTLYAYNIATLALLTPCLAWFAYSTHRLNYLGGRSKSQIRARRASRS